MIIMTKNIDRQVFHDLKHTLVLLDLEYRHKLALIIVQIFIKVKEKNWQEGHFFNPIKIKNSGVAVKYSMCGIPYRRAYFY